MKVMITFNHTEGVWDSLSQAERDAHAPKLAALISALAGVGSQLVFLGPPPQAKTVRQHPDGKVEVLEGPARPGPEQAGGYYIVEVDSMEEAVEWARRGRFMTGSNEVRRIYEAPGG